VKKPRCSRRSTAATRSRASLRPIGRASKRSWSRRPDVTANSASAAHVEMAAPGGESFAPPTLASNVETLANVPAILPKAPTGSDRSEPDESPGTIVCTITGRTQRQASAEFPMGTPLREVVETIGIGPEDGHRFTACSRGSRTDPAAELLDTPMSHEAMHALATGLGTGGFIVFDDRDDLVAVAAGVSRFLAVESCGQCTPCKQDGLALSRLLTQVSRSDATTTISRPWTGCSTPSRTAPLQPRLPAARRGRQHPGALPRPVQDHVTEAAPALEPEPIVPILDIVDGGRSSMSTRPPSSQIGPSTPNSRARVPPTASTTTGPTKRSESSQPVSRRAGQSEPVSRRAGQSEPDGLSSPGGRPAGVPSPGEREVDGRRDSDHQAVDRERSQRAGLEVPHQEPHGQVGGDRGEEAADQTWPRTWLPLAPSRSGSL